MKLIIIAFYKQFIEEGSSIAKTADMHGITNTECYLLVKIGKRLSGN